MQIHILAISDESFSRALHQNALDFQQKMKEDLENPYLGVYRGIFIGG